MIAILVGIWLRAGDVERKVVWHDEVATELHVAGHTEAQVAALLDRRSGVSTREISALLSSRGPGESDRPAPLPAARGVLGALAEAEPQTAPAFFLATRAAVDLGADCIRSARTISLLSGIATIAVAGALGAALTGSALAGWISAGLVAVSPVQIRYSQEARSYALWVLLALASTLSLVRARERNTLRSWLARTYTWLMKRRDGPSALALPGDPETAEAIGVDRGPSGSKVICFQGDQFLLVCPR